MCLHGPMVHGFHSCSILFIVPAVGPWDVRAGRAPPTSRLRRPGHALDATGGVRLQEVRDSTPVRAAPRRRPGPLRPPRSRRRARRKIAFAATRHFTIYRVASGNAPRGTGRRPDAIAILRFAIGTSDCRVTRVLPTNKGNVQRDCNVCVD